MFMVQNLEYKEKLGVTFLSQVFDDLHNWHRFIVRQFIEGIIDSFTLQSALTYSDIYTIITTFELDGINASGTNPKPANQQQNKKFTSGLCDR